MGELSANDVRRSENMPPIENGDGYMQPLDMGPLGIGPCDPANTNYPRA